MPPFPGENLLLTLFVDVHYFFQPPTSKPAHHRFDRRSYLYLYQDVSQRRARIEIANSAGTPDQDSFDGYLDSVVVKYKHQQSNSVSIGVDALASRSTASLPGQSQWRIPAYDLQNAQKYLFKLHALDVYFWTASDASRFLECMKRLLPQDQLDFDEGPLPVEHRDSMSPVVEKLENAAVHTSPRPQPATYTLPQRVASISPPQSTPSFAPYNPAAPAAPEPIAYREKTPPPPDAEAGTGLVGVANHGNNPQSVAQPQLSHHLSYQQTPSQSSFPGPPQRSASSQSVPPPPQSTSNVANMGAPYQHARYELSGPSFDLSARSHNSVNDPTQFTHVQYANHPQQNYLQSPSFSIQSPGLPGTPSAPPPYGQLTPLQSPNVPGAGFQNAGYSGPPGHPVGGYSSYTYASQSQHPQAGTESYGVHDQVYRPTEEEASHGKIKKAQPFKPGTFEEKVGKLEKGVGRLLRKIDNKI
ncbi:hypothetical protein AAFC00_006411 [Neodothiora populina]|uniref:RNA recognition motif-containing protein n=1 Tax=Neodothiora populina TaxID=2781224 RepID=A0ABR3P597_9PEZI